MRAGRAAPGALALLLCAAPAVADEPATFHGWRPVLSVRGEGENNNGVWTLDTYKVSGRGAPLRFVVRRTRSAGTKLLSLQWADSATCLALIPRLDTPTSLQLTFTPFSRPPDKPYRSGLDGIYVTLTARAEPLEGGALGEMSIGGDLGPWVDWWSATEQALDACWSGTEPALTTGG